YYEARRRWPDFPVLMGVGNLTELTEVDSAGVNMLLAGICQELGITSVLTTEVIHWARSSVQEFDLARRLVRHAVKHQTLPKHVDSSLVLLRDARINEFGAETLERMASSLTDPNFRIFVERGEVHVMNRDGYWRGTDAFELFDRFTAGTAPLDASHAFYLGYELSKAVTALTVGKRYIQDSALTWGFLTVPEVSAHERRRTP
ncbi:MAG: dihydropteroate synthase, partial [Planctomycetaceae bacterium]|nr:dihydropteroate synthase [Planctomycetaceae bacterium]